MFGRVSVRKTNNSFTTEIDWLSLAGWLDLSRRMPQARRKIAWMLLFLQKNILISMLWRNRGERVGRQDSWTEFSSQANQCRILGSNGKLFRRWKAVMISMSRIELESYDVMNVMFESGVINYRRSHCPWWSLCMQYRYESEWIYS